MGVQFLDKKLYVTGLLRLIIMLYCRPFKVLTIPGRHGICDKIQIVFFLIQTSLILRLNVSALRLRLLNDFSLSIFH